MLSTFTASVRDGLSNLAASLGAGKDKAASDAFMLRDLSRAEIEAMYRGDWLARKVVDIVPADMCREWRTWSGERADVARIEAAERRLSLRRAVQRAMVLGRLYGGGAIVIGTGERDPAALARPLDPFDIRPGDLRFLHVVSRWQLGTPGLDRDPLSPWYGEASAFDGVTLPFRIKSLGTTTYRTAELVGFDPSLLRIGSPPQPRAGPPKLGSFGPPLIEFIPLPPVTGAEPDLWAPRIAAFAVPWGGVDVYRSNGGGGFDYVTSVEKPSVMGQLTSPLYAGPVGRWDRGNVVSLRLYGSGQLLSLSEGQVLAGAGAIAVKSASGDWEVLQYQTAQLVAPGSYNLSVLLRGQLGTEGAMANPAPMGSRIVVLDQGTLALLPMSVDQRDLVQVLRYGPSAFGPAHPTYTEVDLAFTATGLRPFSVAQVEAVRALPAEDVTFTWVRRTRFAGDSWDPDPVPLNEETEAYDLEVTDGSGRVVRTVRGLTAPTWFYPAGLQTADFGAPQPSYTINLYQLSAIYGRGQVATATVFP